jgi:hypothetical protein
VLAALALAGVHVGLILYFFASKLPLSPIPFNFGDHATHAAQNRAVIEGLATAGEHWIYDVRLLAGAPNGVLFDADNKAWELWTYALMRLGVNPGKAVNGFVLLVHAVLPVAMYATARLFRLDRWAALTTTALAIALWFFDSFTHWAWFVGAISYVFAAFLGLLPLALLVRYLEDRRLVFALGAAPSLAFVHLVHPYVFFTLVVPMTALVVRAAVSERSLGAREYAVVAAIAGLTVLANVWWLRTALRFVHYLLDSAYLEDSGLDFLVYDGLGLLKDWTTQGMIGPRTGVRLLALLCAVFGLRAWRRDGDRRRLPLLSLIVTTATLTYLGGYTLAEQIQPYRHALPLGFALTIPAGWWLRELARSRPWRGSGRASAALSVVLAALAVQLLARDVLYFFAPSMAQTQTLHNGRLMPMNALGHAATLSYRYDEQHEWEQIVGLVAQRDQADGSRGRWLVDNQALGEYLMARTDTQILGGFALRNIEHSDANWFRRADPPYDAEAMRAYFETYAVRWVVIEKLDADPFWDSHPQLLTRAGIADGMLVYKVHLRAALVHGDSGGEARVEARTNRVAVTGTRAEDELVLRYHWMEGLACEPDCSIAREPVDGDRVGFIRVLAPHPRDFAIVNRYSM